MQRKVFLSNKCLYKMNFELDKPVNIRQYNI